jgi:hypothetical protein
LIFDSKNFHHFYALWRYIFGILKKNSPINIKYIWGMLVTYSYFKKVNFKKLKLKLKKEEEPRW